MGKTFFSYFNEDNIYNIVDGVKGKMEYKCTIPYTEDLSKLLITRVVMTLLDDVKETKLQQSLIVIVNELINNANRINIIGDYFSNNSLNLTDKNDFLKGQQKLADGKYFKHYTSKKLYIKIHIKVNSRELYLKLENGRELSTYEIEALKKTFDYSDRFNSLKQLLNDDSKISERVDFGMILALLMLKNCNINKDSIIFRSADGITITELTIPFSQLSEKTINKITNEISNEIKTLPQFPESIRRLQKEIMDPEWDYDRISDYILSDSALTVEILRLVNSPVYRVRDKIEKVSIAVKKIGINGLKAILYNFGSLHILESKYNLNKITNYKEHLFQVALISSYLANYNKLDNFSEDIYVAALMHDIGKILIRSINPELYEKLNKVCNDTNFPINVVDTLSDGYNHSTIGANMTKIWDFPEKYVNAIKYHHIPQQVSDEYKIITYCVYLGNEITQIIEEKANYNSLNSTVLKFFNMDSKENFDKFIKAMKTEGIII